MIIEVVTTEDGQERRTYRPENAADERELRRMAEAGEIQVGERESDFDPEVERELVEAGIIEPD